MLLTVKYFKGPACRAGIDTQIDVHYHLMPVLVGIWEYYLDNGELVKVMAGNKRLKV